jgi:uncharacterized protein (DUF1330 family)
LAQSGHTEIIRYLSAFGAKRTIQIGFDVALGQSVVSSAASFLRMPTWRPRESQRRLSWCEPWEDQMMKTQYTVAIATLAGIAIGGMAVQALHAQTKPRAYVVIEMDVMNQESFFKEFVPAVKTIMDQGGKFLARGGKLVNIEGPGPVYSEVKRLTVVEFENMEKAQATFASPSYSDVRTIGNKHAKFRIVGVEGAPQ